jgi:hypothetical protein
MKSKLFAFVLLAGNSAFAATHVFFGVGAGYAAPAPAVVYGPPPPPVVAYAPGYARVAGYYAPAGPRRVWRPGYWARPPYARSYGVAPRYYGGRFYGGYWRR